jgi:hypothetical protein
VLKKVARAQGARSDRNSTLSRTETKFRDLLKDKGIDKSRANEAEHIGALPEPELQKAFAAEPRATSRWRPGASSAA